MDKYINNEDIFCVTVNIGYGKGNKNPVTESTTFYSPSDKNSNLNSYNSDNHNNWTIGLLPKGIIIVFYIYKISF